MPVARAQATTPPQPLNVGEVRERLRARLGWEEKFWEWDAVAVYVVVDGIGTAVRARALPPRILGIIPRVMPTVYDSDGYSVPGVRWASDRDVLAAAAEVAMTLEFIGGQSEGAGMKMGCRVAIPMALGHSPEPA